MRLLLALSVLVWLLVVGSSLGAVYARHEARNEFMRLQRLEAERDELTIEWGRLQIEQSTWSTHARIEQKAHEQLQMFTPEAAEVAIVFQ